MTTDYRCDHDPAAVCWLCSDQVPWWREARIKKGLPAEPSLSRRMDGHVLDALFRKKRAS
jgi:hypothetical protein